MINDKGFDNMKEIKTIKENTVSAKNQMIHSSELSFLGDECATTKILVVGNSITRHGPLAEIGWNNDWGMAASALEKDYVHRLYSKLKEDGKNVYMRIRQCSFWEISYLKKEDILSYYDQEREFEADIVVFRLGENVPDADKPYFKDALRRFISHICPKGKVVFTTCFWKNEIIDEAIEDVAKERGDICINGNFAVEAKNMALGQFEHGGVAAHPSDEGMEATAQAIYEVICQL